MADRIPREFIDQVLAQTDVVDLIGVSVALRKAGRNYIGLCPFHAEKTPSFSVSREKQFYYCFGCGASGNVLSFLMNHLGMEFLPALEELAGRLGLALPRSAKGEPQRQLEPLYQSTRQASAFYRQKLQHEQVGKVARDYLRERGIGQQIIEEYGLGYAPPGWEHLRTALGRDTASLRALEQAGLIRHSEQSGYHDRFRSRLMFPILSHRQEVLGFGARTLTDDEPKYLNSPQTPIFNKSGILYGLHSITSRRSLQQLYVVEGYMDVLMLAQHGIRNAVATLGTAVTSAHLQQLFRFCSRLTLCFDGDAAGRKAARQVMETALPLLLPGRELEFMFLPEGQDPDSFVRHQGPDRFQAAELRTSFSNFLLSQLREGADLNSLEGRSKLQQRAAGYLQPLADRLLRRLILQELAKWIEVEPDYLERMLEESRQGRPGPAPAQVQPRRQRRPGSLPQPSLLGSAIALLLQRPQLALTVSKPASLREWQVEGIDFLVELLQLIHTKKQIGCAAILERWRDTPYERRLQELAAGSLLLEETEHLEQEFEDALARLRQRHFRQRFRQLARQSKGAPDPAQRKELRSLQESLAAADAVKLSP